MRLVIIVNMAQDSKQMLEQWQGIFEAPSLIPSTNKQKANQKKQEI